MPTPALVVQYAALAEVYAANAVARGALFSPYTDPRLPKMINMERKALLWKYSYDPTDTTDLVAVANYVWAICGKFGLMAQSTITSGGGSVTPGTPSFIKSPIQIRGDDFASALSWTGTNGVGVNVLSTYTIQVFWNELNRFLIESTEWTRTANGFDIIVNGTTITGFDATGANSSDIFLVFISI